MPIFIVWVKDNFSVDACDIKYITNTFELAKKMVKDDEECGIKYQYHIEEYWLHTSE